jgi:hypothetical protein
MGGRLPLTMHGASIGSWACPAAPRCGNWHGQFSTPGAAANASPSGVATVGPGLQAAPRSAEKLVFYQGVNYGETLRPEALHKSQRGR